LKRRTLIKIIGGAGLLLVSAKALGSNTLSDALLDYAGQEKDIRMQDETGRLSEHGIVHAVNYDSKNIDFMIKTDNLENQYIHVFRARTDDNIAAVIDTLWPKIQKFYKSNPWDSFDVYVHGDYVLGSKGKRLFEVTDIILDDRKGPPRCYPLR
jgi:hypothetical protein